MENVLITGAEGYVGKTIMNDLKGKYNIIGLDLHNISGAENIFICDLLDKAAIQDCIARLDIDYVIHCAAIAHNDGGNISEDLVYQVNYEGTKNLVDVLLQRNIKKFVFFSTVAVYGEFRLQNTSVNIDAPISPISAYGHSKFDAERYVFSTNLSSKIIRFPVIYSENNFLDLRKRVLPLKILGQDIIFKIGNGKQKHSVCNLNQISILVQQALKVEYEQSIIHGVSENMTTNQIIDFVKVNQASTIVLWLPRFLIIFLFEFLALAKGKNKKVYRSYRQKLVNSNIYNSGFLRNT